MLSPTERANAISALSTPRLRNILAYLADEAESENSRATIETLIRLRSFTHEEFPDPEFVDYAESKLGPVTPSSREQSSGTQNLRHVSHAPSKRESTEPGEIKPELSDVNHQMLTHKSPLDRQGSLPQYAHQDQNQNKLPARKRSRSPQSHQQGSPTKTPRQTVFAHDIRRSRRVAVRHLGFQGSWYENYDYIVAIDPEDMLTIFPPRQADRVTGNIFPRKDAFRRTPVSKYLPDLQGRKRLPRRS